MRSTISIKKAIPQFKSKEESTLQINKPSTSLLQTKEPNVICII
jgi:hypothetical protein